MNRNRLIGFAIAALILAILAFAAWSLFEIYPMTRYIEPSREARMNVYLALDRWLQSSGIPLRVENSGNLPMLIGAKEKYIFMQASLFEWSSEAVDYLAGWIENGGTLFLVLDIDPNAMLYYSHSPSQQGLYGEEPLLLLEKFGITVETGDEMNAYKYRFETEYLHAPSFDHDISFDVSGEPDSLELKDWAEAVRLVRVKRGKGVLIVSGRPVFLQSPYIGYAPNAFLAWELFLAENPEAGSRSADSLETGLPKTPLPESAWLFILGELKARGILGSLWKQGNFAVLIVSVLVLLIISFWALIPVFGVIRMDREMPGKPLRMRFLAEGRFLKRYGALSHYLRVYIKEIKRRLARKEGHAGDDETERRLHELICTGLDEREQALFFSAYRGEPFKYRDFPAIINIFNMVLELL